MLLTAVVILHFPHRSNVSINTTGILRKEETLSLEKNWQNGVLHGGQILKFTMKNMFLINDVLKSLEWRFSTESYRFQYILCHNNANIETPNCMTQNHAKAAPIMVLIYYYLIPVRKVSLQAQRDRCCSLVKLLCIYFYYFDLLNHG